MLLEIPLTHVSTATSAFDCIGLVAVLLCVMPGEAIFAAEGEVAGIAVERQAFVFGLYVTVQRLLLSV